MVKSFAEVVEYLTRCYLNNSLSEDILAKHMDGVTLSKKQRAVLYRTCGYYMGFNSHPHTPVFDGVTDIIGGQIIAKKEYDSEFGTSVFVKILMANEKLVAYSGTASWVFGVNILDYVELSAKVTKDARLKMPKLLHTEPFNEGI